MKKKVLLFGLLIFNATFAKLIPLPGPASINYECRAQTITGNLTSFDINSPFLNSGPGCLTPSNLFSNNITGTTATLNWDAALGAQTYTIQYRIVGTGGWNISPGTGDNFFTQMNLLGNTNYEWQVQSNCIGGGTSAFSSSAFFTTLCTTPAASITANGSTTFCSGGSVLLTANSGAGYTYQWQINGVNIAGQTSISYSAVSSGIYTVIETSVTCSATSNAIVVTSGQSVLISQPDAVLGKDAILNSFGSQAGNNYGTGKDLPASTWSSLNGPYKGRSLIQFDLSSIPANANVTGAFLGLYANDANSSWGQHSTQSGSNNAWIQRVTSPWDESTVTWNNQPGSTTVNRTGIPATTSASQDFNSIDITALILDILLNPSNNYGLILKLDTENYYRQMNFCSSDYTNPLRRPKLVLYYSVPNIATITPQGPISFCSGGNVVLSANSGNGLTYQWKNNGTDISGATNQTYTANVAGNYTVAVTSTCSSLTSSPVTVTINSLPSATITPSGSTTFCPGGNVILNAPFASNRTYQWKKGANLISGATLSSYSATTGGNYRVIVTNTVTGCSKTSGSATVVTVNPLPVATITPQGPTTFCAGGSVVLAANTGAGLTYKWKKAGGYISGATLSNYTATTGGNYRVEVTNSNGCSKTSGLVAVSVPCKEGENISRENNFDFAVYPNPNSGEFIIKFSTKPTSMMQLELTDEIGKVVKRLETNDETVVIKESNLAKGIYSLAARNKNKIVIKKINIVK